MMTSLKAVKRSLFKLSTVLVLGSLMGIYTLPSYAVEEEAGDSAQVDLDALMAPPEIGYYELKPDFTTSLFSTGSRLHYLRVKISLMLDDSRDADFVGEKEPLIRDLIVTILGSKDYTSVSSSAGREALRSECRARISELLNERAGRKIINDVLFTNYVYR